MANAVFLHDVDQVLAIIGEEIETVGWASEVEFTDPDTGNRVCGKVFEVREREGEVELFGKEYSDSEFTWAVSELADLAIFAVPRN